MHYPCIIECSSLGCHMTDPGRTGVLYSTILIFWTSRVFDILYGLVWSLYGFERFSGGIPRFVTVAKRYYAYYLKIFWILFVEARFLACFDILVRQWHIFGAGNYRRTVRRHWHNPADSREV